MNKCKLGNKQHVSYVRVPIILKLAVGLLHLFMKGLKYPGIKSSFSFLMEKISKNYYLLGRLTRYLKGIQLHKLNELGLFSSPDDTPSEGDESDEVKVTGDYDVWYPFKRIPDVRSFKVHLSGYDGVGALFDVQKRQNSDFEFDKYTNKKYNIYLERQLKRLNGALNGKVIDESKGPLYFKSKEDGINNTVAKKQRTYDKRKFEVVRITKSNPELYFRICSSLVKYSRVFYVLQLSSTFPHGHRVLPYRKVLEMYLIYRKQTRDPYARINYMRVFIPKPNSKQRPLGVPTLPGRIQLGLWNKFLLKFLKGKISKYQHAYQPFKGTISAGKQISKYSEYKNIYSLDLTSFFPSVSLKHCVDVLEGKGVPKDVCEGIRGIHLSIPNNLESNPFEPITISNPDTIDYTEAGDLKGPKHFVAQKFEPDSIDGDNVDDSYVTPGMIASLFPAAAAEMEEYGYTITIRDLFYDPQLPGEENLELKEKVYDYLNGLRSGEVKDSIKELLILERMKPSTLYPKSQQHEWEMAFNYLKVDNGVPQGAPISPLVAIMALEDTLIQRNTSLYSKVVGYSDDWLFFSNDDSIGVFDFPEYGISLAESKSHGVKRNGVGLTPLTFLGLSFDGVENKLNAFTRNGSRLKFDKENIMDYIDYGTELKGCEECNYFERTKDKPYDEDGNKRHCGVCSKDLGDSIDCPSPTLCSKGKGKRNDELLNNPESKTGKDMMNSRIVGFVQSRLYNGKGNFEEFEQNFKLTHKPSSSVHLHKKLGREVGELNVFTSTSYAIGALIEDLNKYKSGKSIRRNFPSGIKRKESKKKG